MTQKYDRKALAFFLADLGEKLGRPPRPSDLKKGMPSRSTFMRYFDNWGMALEYAGYVEDHKEEAKIINLLGVPVIFVGPNGESEIFQPSGKTMIARTHPKIPCVATELASQIGGLLITSSEILYVGVKSPNKPQFPKYKEGTYYLVPESVARNVCHFGRTSKDLIYPGKQSSYVANGIAYIGALYMVHTDDLPLIES